MVLLPFELLSIEKNAVVEGIINKVNIDSLSKTIKILSGAEPYHPGDSTAIIKTRRYDSDDNLEAANFLKDKLASYGLDTELSDCGTSCENVIAVQKGYEFPDIYLIIGGHFDSVAGEENAPGANDNATGSAVVIEAARLLSQYETRYSVIYALWDAEEPKLTGSRYHAKQVSSDGDSILCVINGDMMGWDGNSDYKMNVYYDSIGVSVKAAEITKQLNDLFEIGLDVEITPKVSGSDHLSFLFLGISAIHLSEDHNVILILTITIRKTICSRIFILIIT